MTRRAVSGTEIEGQPGAPIGEQRARRSLARPGCPGEVDSHVGAPTRHVDEATALLHLWAGRWRKLQEARKRFVQWELDPSCKGCRAHLDGAPVLPASNHKPHCLVAGFALAENRAQRELTKVLRAHPLWPWLSQYPGLGGGHVALVIGKIGDPRRFPGQRCTEGHYLPAVYSPGSACPVVSDRRTEVDEAFGDSRADDGEDVVETQTVCPGVVENPRLGSGSRALWHWMGLAPGADGRAMRKRKGQRVSWDPQVRASIMQPGGVAEQIVRLKVPGYEAVYRAKKALLMNRVTVDSPVESGETGGRLDQASVVEERVGTAGSSPAVGQQDGRPGVGDVVERRLGTADSLPAIVSEHGRPEYRHEVEGRNGTAETAPVSVARSGRPGIEAAAERAVGMADTPGGAVEKCGRPGEQHEIERGVGTAEAACEREGEDGRPGVGDVVDARLGTADTDVASVTDSGRPLRLFEAERIARTFAVKQFWADLLQEWKRLVETELEEAE